ncbi:uncharacterized protein Fot_01144 [Forsythia ovata]|uniref:Protein kinase domain-containing protein n=1 Tax=Forsythia ovata TaxID=205694 RepID=A0ABD1X3Z8_9LAMI
MADCGKLSCLLPRNETDLEAINICGDCKFLFLEDLEATTPDSYRRRTLGLRRRRYNSSESIESLFPYQFSQMITLARQTQSTVLEHDNQSIDGDGTARLVQLTITRTTPSGSRRWRRVFSDTESDGFDSFYGDNESNVNFRRYRHFPSEDDTISYTTYGGDSDASIDEDDEEAPLEDDVVRSLRTSPIHSTKEMTSIDDFEIIKSISHGAFGRVFLAKKENNRGFVCDNAYPLIKVKSHRFTLAKRSVTDRVIEQAIEDRCPGRKEVFQGPGDVRMKGTRAWESLGIAWAELSKDWLPSD